MAEAATELLEEEVIEPQGMTEQELVKYCTDQISKGIGGTDDSDGQTDIELPLDYYFGRKPAISKVRSRDPNSSRYVSQDVRDGIEATVAEIMPAFSNQEIAFYEPCDELDEDQAKSESDIVNYLFMEEYDGYTILQTALKDALLHRNCTGKVFWDERIEVEYEQYDDVPELALAQLLEPSSDKENIEVVEQYITEEGDDAARLLVEQVQDDPSMLQGIAPEEQQLAAQILEDAQDKYSIKIKITKRVERPVIMNVPPEQTIVQSGHNSVYLHTCGFVAHESLETESSLIAQGYDESVVKELKTYTGDVKSQSRTRSVEETDRSTSHSSTRLIKVHECYAEIDFDGDGIAERRKIVLSDSTLLDNEEFGGMAMVGGAVTIMPHKYRAISMFERLCDIQDAKTPVMRSIIDGTQLASNPRLGVVTGAANIDDILTSRTGGVVRFEEGMGNGVFEMPNPQIPASSYQFLDHMDGVRRDRGGGAVDSSAQANMVGGDSGHGIERVMTKMEMNNALLARTLGETFVRGIFIELHNLLRKNHPKGEAIKAKVGGRWVQTVPSEWKKRTSVTIQVGDSMAERNRQSMLLQKVIELQTVLADKGSVMYEESKSYTAISDSIRLAGIRAPERYFLDPASPEGVNKGEQQAQMKQEMKQVEQQAQMVMVQAQQTLADAEKMKAKADNDGNMVKIQNENLKAQIAQLKERMDVIKENAELQFKYHKADNDLAFALTKLEVEKQTEASEQLEENRADGE